MTAALHRAAEAQATSQVRMHQADVTIRLLHRALYDALEPKLDGTRHHYVCRNRHVNAGGVPCSKRCAFAAGVALLAEDWEDGIGLPEVSSQVAMFEEVAG